MGQNQLPKRIMKLTIYQVDAFTEVVFKGNPAAVCPINEWLSDDVLLKVAAENNVSATIFYVIKDNTVDIRWFTPKKEIALLRTRYTGYGLCIIPLRKLLPKYYQLSFPT